MLLKAKPAQSIIFKKIKSDIARFRRPPKLVTILVGDDPASKLYVQKKTDTCALLGMHSEMRVLPATTTEEQLIALIRELNTDAGTDGILVQAPLPKPIRSRVVFDEIHPDKDVDGFHPINAGLLSQDRPLFPPCTSAGIISLLDFYNIPIEHKHALVIGRSDIVGKPLSLMLLHRDATVTMAHSKTLNLPHLVKDADIIVSAVGKPSLLNGNFEYKHTATVIDVGINRLNDALVGDVDFDTVSVRVANISPVPGGVGPMTIAILMKNLVAAYIKNSTYRGI